MSINTAAFNILPIGRTPEMQANYVASLAEKRENFSGDMPCPFCWVEGGLRDEQIIDEHKGVIIARNDFPYVADNGQKVLEQELIIPPAHVTDIDQLPKKQAKAFNDALTWRRCKFGRSVMMRANNDKTKSVPHAHAHGFVYGPRVIHHYYDPLANINEYYFEGEEDKVTAALGRHGLIVSQESA